MERAELAGPWLAIGAAATAIVELGLGEQLRAWLQVLWPVLVIAWSGLVLYHRPERIRYRRLIDEQARTIEVQASVIRQAGELNDELMRNWRPR